MTMTQNIDAVIAYLVDRKFKRSGDAPFPSFESWRQSREGTLEPFLPLSQDEAKYQADLKRMSDTDLKVLLADVRNQEAEQQKAREELQDQQRFFHEPGALADFNHWSKMARWTAEEAAALALGKDPTVVNWESVKRELPSSPFANQYAKFRELMLRARDAGELEFDVRPRDFLAWTAQKSIALPEELKTLVRAADHETETWESLKAERDDLKRKAEALNPKERQSLLKLVLGMAVAKYGYDPKKPRPKTFQEIKGDLDLVSGISLDVDTVRKWVSEATEKFSGQIWDDS